VSTVPEGLVGSRLNPYISFRDTAKDAMAFYQSVFGGELTSSTFGEAGGSPDPGDQDKIMHAQLETPSGFTLMASDTPAGMEAGSGTNISVSLSGDDDAELRGSWDKLADGATIIVPLEPAPWGDVFGMLTDKYGVNWLVNIAGAPRSE
jgi:PhnB protein